MPTPLSEMIRKARLLAMSEIAAPMESLAASATELALPHAAREIRSAITELREHRFRVMLVGGWNCGKSTLLNALSLGHLEVSRDGTEQHVGYATAFVAASNATIKQIVYTIVRVMEPCSQRAAVIAAKVAVAKSISVVRPMPLPMLKRIVRDHTADEAKACLRRWVTDAQPTREAAIGTKIDSFFDHIHDSVTTAIRGRVEDLKAGVRVILKAKERDQSEINAVLQSHEAASAAVVAAIASMKAGLASVASAANTPTRC